MTDYMVASLKKFITEESMSRIENSGARIWKETYKEAKQRVKPFINVVFSRYQADNTSETDMGTAGYVLAIPAYWIDVSVELAIIYISSFVDTYLQENFGYGSNDSSDSSGSNSGGGCGGRPKPCPVHPKPPAPPAPPAIPQFNPPEPPAPPKPEKPDKPKKKPPHHPKTPPPPIFNPPPPEDVARPIEPGEFTYMSPIPPEMYPES